MLCRLKLPSCFFTAGADVSGSAFSARALAWAGHYNAKLVAAVRKRKAEIPTQPVQVTIPCADNPEVKKVYLASKVYGHMIYLQELQTNAAGREYEFKYPDDDGDADTLASQSAAYLFAQIYVSGCPKVKLSVCDVNFASGTVRELEDLFDLDVTLDIAPKPKPSRKKAVGAAPAAGPPEAAALPDGFGVPKLLRDSHKQR
jgi:hypothetical protein